MVATILTALLAGSPMEELNTNALNAALEQARANGYKIVTQIDASDETWKEILSDLGIDPECILNYPLFQFPECDRPENDTPVLPEAPETELPDAPETETPEAPETEAPEQSVSMAQQVANLVNQERAKAGLSPLTLREDLTAAAQIRAKETAVSFSHTRPDGSNFHTVLTQQQISYRRSGENIAWGQPTAQAVMNAWMNSQGHRANILNASYEYIGVGYYTDSQGTPYWTQLFISD